jgi:hypothetical protein
MNKQWRIQFLILAAVAMAAMATSASAYPADSALHEANRHSVSVVDDSGYTNVSISDRSEAAGSLIDRIEKESTSVREVSRKAGSRAKRNATANAAVQNKEDEGSKCLRGAPCVCTATGHGVTNCYIGYGDCYNHEGILCIWE